MREQLRTLGFAASVCVVCSLLLSAAAAGLAHRIAANTAYDQQRNLVQTFGIDPTAHSRAEIEALHRQHIREITLVGRTLYTWTETGASAPTKYAIPLTGQGLWGPIEGTVALDPDLATIVGISFHKHHETPGLGAEIERTWFHKRFIGKQLFTAGAPSNFRIVRPGTGRGGASEVDGLSGATLTGQGIEAMLRRAAEAHMEPFNTIREERAHDR